MQVTRTYEGINLPLHIFPWMVREEINNQKENCFIYDLQKIRLDTLISVLSIMTHFLLFTVVFSILENRLFGYAMPMTPL